MKNSKKLTSIVLSLVMAMLLSCSGNDEPIQEVLPQFENTETMTVWDEDIVQLNTNIWIDSEKYDLFVGDSKQAYTTYQFQNQSSIISFKAEYKAENEGKELPIVLKDKQGKTITSGGKIKILSTYRYYPTYIRMGSPYFLSTFVWNTDNSFSMVSVLGAQDNGTRIRQFDYSKINDSIWTKNTSGVLVLSETVFYPPEMDLGHDIVPGTRNDRFYALGFAKQGNKFYFPKLYRPVDNLVCPIFVIDGNTVSTYKYNDQTIYFSSQPTDIVADRQGNLYVHCVNTPAIYKLNETSGIQLFAGSETESGYQDGKGKDARFGKPLDDGIRNMLIDGNDNLYVAEKTKIRKITPDGTVSTFIGTNDSADVIGSMSNARFTDIKAFAMTKKNVIYLTEENTDYIKIIDPGKQTVIKMKVVDVPGYTNHFNTSNQFRMVVNEQGTIFMEMTYLSNGSMMTILCPTDLQKKN